MKFIKNIKNKIKKDFKEVNLSEKSIGLGLVFGVMFWLVFDSIAMGIGLGVAMMFAFNEEEKRKNNKKKNNKDSVKVKKK